MWARVLAAGSVIGFAGIASADVPIWYGGDFDGRGDLVDGFGFGSDSIVYDDFSIPSGGASVTSMYGTFIGVSGGSIAQAVVEIRQGVSEHNGGALVYGAVLSASSQFLGQYGELDLWRVRATGFSVGLPAGTYWAGFAAVNSNRIWIGTTSGQSGVGGPIADGNSFYTSMSRGFNFEPVNSPNVFGPGVWDFSMGLDGQVVPEPDTLGQVLVLLLTVLVARVKRRAPGH